MTYAVDFVPAARRQFLNLPKALQERIAPLIDALARNPRPPGVKKLKGREDCWRIRVGDYRILYTIRDNRLFVLVLRIGHRREVYA